ncbi:MAG: DNA translocase FtsK [Verrucomicrobiae bacterium]|nr:DNA translocase FtsK [Verrucomicrobiae bacterium]
MTNDELIGKVAIRYLRERLADSDGSDGTARYLLDCLSAKQAASIATTILNDTDLCSRVEIKLPRNFVMGIALPEDILTDERTTYFRNADCKKEALVLATTGDDEQQSLKEMMPIGSSQLLGHPELWVDYVNAEIGFDESKIKWWIQALKGLLEVRTYQLEAFAGYILETRRQIREEGEPLLEALGLALPALRIPRDKTFFTVLNEKNAGHLSRWKQLYNKATRQRSCYLLKYTPSQGLLTQDLLGESFGKVKDSIPEKCHPQINDFILSDSGWNASAAALCDCEWEVISPLFDGLKKEKFNLGRKTLEFYDDRDSSLLSNEENGYLENLANRGVSTTPDATDEDFYESHRLELKDDNFLKSKWDKFIYGTPVESEDFLVGIAACLEGMFGQSETVQKKVLSIKSDRRTKQDLKRLNYEAGEYFAFRYQGLPKMLGLEIQWDVGELFSFKEHLNAWRKEKKPKLNRSVAKAALRIKFYLDLQITYLNGVEQSISKQLVWTFNPNAVASELSGDWGRLSEHPLVRCFASRETISGKGNVQSVDLRDSKTLHASYAQDRGSFVPVYRKENDLALLWKMNLDKAFNEGLITQELREEIESCWQTFEGCYIKAIQEFGEYGFLADGISQQCKAYSELLDFCCEKVKGDRSRELLLWPLLEIGTARISGDKITAIVTPWHPLRLFAMNIKLEQTAGLLKALLSLDAVRFSDSRLYFRELTDGLRHPYYPELAMGWDANAPKLLSCTDFNLDYSLHENPLAEDDGLDETNENPTVTAALVLDLIKKYLKLYPHEKANLSTVLFNCDCARLPTAIVDKIAELHEDEDDMRCEIVLRHRDSGTLINLYERIIESSDEDIDSFVASEATTDFMARLRIGIMANQAPTPDPKAGRPTDIVFLQDVIARHAEIEWYSDESLPVDAINLVPSQWARRKPAAKDEMKSVVYLACPVQTREGWNFINALSCVMKPHLVEIGRHLLPARQLNFNDSRTADIFDEIHKLGNWVANYDELLDRRQLLNQNVRVIRYKQFSSQGRNMLISSTAPLGLLKGMVKGRIKSLNLGLDEIVLADLVERFIDEANEVSGDLVLRAAKRGRNASELMGVVLSKYLIEDELGSNSLHGWFFLDDYAEWLGQREEQIADLMALCPIVEDGCYKLGIIVSEAKYIDCASLSPKRKESQKQLRDTVRRIRDALFGDPACMDRDLWLSRLSNLVMNGVHIPSTDTASLSTWRDAVIRGDCEIFIRGYSHVFVSGPADSPECSDFVDVAELEEAYQEVFSRNKVRELVRAYTESKTVGQIRKDNAEKDVWKERTWQAVSQDSGRQLQGIETESSTVEILDHSEIAPSETKQTVITAIDAVVPSDEEVVGTLMDRLNLAFPVDSVHSDHSATWLQQTAALCKGALQQFQLKSKLISSRLTPNCALLKFEGSANLTVDQVRKRQSEFLTSHGLNIIAVSAEPGVVSLAIARPEREVLLLQKVWKDWDVTNVFWNSSLLIGIREEDGNPLYFSPQKNAPHTLVAGITGSGKSVLIQNIILNIALTNTPENASIILIDPKRVDFNKFQQLPHVDGVVIKTKEDAIQKIIALVYEMERRYRVFEAHNVTDISELKKQYPDEPMPIIWAIHDELALWMMDVNYADQITTAVNQLAVAARAAGIFLIFGAQRPDNTVLPMQLRSNLGNRLVLKVDSVGTSEIALGEKGAERLMGKGHLAAKLEGEADTVLAQVPFVDDAHISFIVSEISKQYSLSTD